MTEMKYMLRKPSGPDFVTLGSWICDAEQCQRWAGPALAFPFDHQMLPSLLETEVCDSYALVDADGGLAGFGQIFRREPETGHLGRIIIDPQRRKLGVGQILCKESRESDLRKSRSHASPWTSRRCRGPGSATTGRSVGISSP